MAATQSFSVLFKQSYHQIKGNWKTFCSLVLVFAIVMLVLQMTIFLPFVNQLEQGMGGIAGAGLSAINPSLPEGINQELALQMQGMNPEQQAAQIAAVFSSALVAFGPMLAAGVLVAILVAIWLPAAATVFGLNPAVSFADALKKGAKFILPLLGLYFWIFLLSWGWVMLLGLALSMFLPIAFLLIPLGIVLQLIFGPRYMLAPVLLIRSGLGIHGSAKQSYAATKGYWGKIVGNLFLAQLCFLGILILVQVVVAIPFALAGDAGQIGRDIVQVVLQQFAVGFLSVFLVHLTGTIIANPKQAA